MGRNHRIILIKEYKNCIILALCLAFALVLAIGYGIGYAKGCKRVLETAQGWQQMYDEHINRQWDLIQKRDSLYMQYIDLKLQNN